MKSNVQETRARMMNLLAETRRRTELALSDIDPERVVHGDSLPWRVRDVIGHIGVWNGEAAQSLRVHAGGGRYHCISSEAKYDEYNGSAVDERRAWTIEQVWLEYKTSHDQLKSLVEGMSSEDWNREMLYPWNEEGAPWRLIAVMMKHEKEHCSENDQTLTRAEPGKPLKGAAPGRGIGTALSLAKTPLPSTAPH